MLALFIAHRKMEYRTVLQVGILLFGTAVVARPADSSVAQVENVYNFHYNVSDSSSGDVKSHSETRHGTELTGFYRFLQPDGCVRVVRYTADVMGFHPIVTYEGNCHLGLLDQAVPPSADDLGRLVLLPKAENVPTASSIQHSPTIEEGSAIDKVQPTDGDREQVMNNVGVPEAPILKSGESAESISVKSHLTAGSETKNPSHSDSAPVIEDNLEEWLPAKSEAHPSNDDVLEHPAGSPSQHHHQTEHHAIDHHPVGHGHPSEHQHFHSLSHSIESSPAAHEETVGHSFSFSDLSESFLEPIEYSIAEQAFRTDSWNRATESSHPLQSGHSEADYSLDCTGQSDPVGHPFAKQGFQAVEQSAELNSDHRPSRFETDRFEQQRETSVGASVSSDGRSILLPVVRMDSSAVPARFGPDQIIVTEVKMSSNDLRLENVPVQEMSTRPEKFSEQTALPEVLDLTAPKLESGSGVFVQNVPESSEKDLIDHAILELLNLNASKLEPTSDSIAPDVPEPLIPVDSTGFQDESYSATKQDTATDDNEHTKSVDLKFNPFPDPTPKSAETKILEPSGKLELTLLNFEESEGDKRTVTNSANLGDVNKFGDDSIEDPTLQLGHLVNPVKTNLEVATDNLEMASKELVEVIRKVIDTGETPVSAAEMDQEGKSVQPVTDVTGASHSTAQTTEAQVEWAKSENVSEQKISLNGAPYPEDRVAKTIPSRKPVLELPESGWKPIVRHIPQTIRIINSHTNPAGRNPGRQITSELIRRPENVPGRIPGGQLVSWRSPLFQVARNSQLPRNPTRTANQQPPKAYIRYRALPILGSSFSGSYGTRIPGYIPQRPVQTLPEYVPLRYVQSSSNAPAPIIKTKPQWSPYYRARRAP